MSGRRRTRTQRLPKLGRGRGRQPRTLRTRLVVSAVALIAVVCAVIGTVTTIALSTHLNKQLNSQVEVASRASGGPMKPGGRDIGEPPPDGPFGFVTKGGTEENTVVAQVNTSGGITNAAVAKEQTSDSEGFQGMSAVTLGVEKVAALADVSKTGIHTVEIPGLGEYRVKYVEGNRGNFYVALPTDSVTSTLNTLIVVELSVTGAGLIAAGIAAPSSSGSPCGRCARSPPPRPGSPSCPCTPVK